MVTQITDYKVFNKPPYLLQQFVDTDIHKFLEMSDRQFNELESALIALFTYVWLDYAVGAQLDVIGVHLDYPRNGLDDLNYKTALRLKIIVMTSGGTHETLISAVRVLFGASTIHYSMIQPAKVLIEQNGAANFYFLYDVLFHDGDTMVTHTGDSFIFTEANEAGIDLLENACPAGVGITIVEQFMLEFHDGFTMADHAGNDIMVDVVL